MGVRSPGQLLKAQFGCASLGIAVRECIASR